MRRVREALGTSDRRSSLRGWRRTRSVLPALAPREVSRESRLQSPAARRSFQTTRSGYSRGVAPPPDRLGSAFLLVESPLTAPRQESVRPTTPHSLSAWTG